MVKKRKQDPLMDVLHAFGEITGNIARTVEAANRPGRIPQKNRLDQLINEELDGGSSSPPPPEEPEEEAPAPEAPQRNGMTKDTARTILGVGPTTTREEVRARYRFLAKAFHPDKVSEKDRGHATKFFQQLNEAHKVLTKG